MSLLRFVRRRSRLVAAIAMVIGVAAVVLYPITEYTAEFDGVGLRTRECMRSRSWLLGFLFSEQCTEPEDHPTAARLRQLGVLAPVVDSEAQWLLTKGFKPGVRGWQGQGKQYLGALGAYTALSPMPFPAAEDLSKNQWVIWAQRDPQAANRFWKHFQTVAKQTVRGADYLDIGRIYFERHDSSRRQGVDEADLEAFIRRVMDEECGVKLPAFN